MKRRCEYCERPLPARKRKWCNPRCRYRACHPGWIWEGEPTWVKRFPAPLIGEARGGR